MIGHTDQQGRGRGAAMARRQDTGSRTGREKCVRGHIPNKLNIAVGQAYKKFI
jgi:hypothetical protein